MGQDLSHGESPRRPARRAGLAALLAQAALVVAVAGCDRPLPTTSLTLPPTPGEGTTPPDGSVGPTGDPSASVPGSPATDPPRTPSPARTTTPSPPTSGLPGADPRRPYTSADVLRVMLLAAGPDRVPDELRRPEVTSVLASAIWTWDGRPYRRWAIEAQCGPESCQLDVQGVPAFGAPDDAHLDAWTFVVRLRDLRVTSLRPNGEQPELHGYPPELDVVLDDIVRADPDVDLRAVTFAGAVWHTPPAFGRFTVRYSDGDEEGGRQLRVLVDALARRVLRVTEVPPADR